VRTHLSLFSGIGGLDLAAEWAGFTTVGQCEFADYPTKVLEKHWPDVPRWRDIRTLTREDFYARTGLRTVDVISGGFPCQPFSVAGKQKGKEDDRYLWPEMLRVIRELQPAYIVGENVSGILRIAADEVCQDLDREGYEVGIFNFEAAAVGAFHRRERVFFVGYAEHNGLSAATVAGGVAKASGDIEKGQKPPGEFEGTGRPGDDADVADTNRTRLSVARHESGNETFSGEHRIEHSGCDAPDTNNGRWAMRRNGELSAVEAAGGIGCDNRGGAQEYVAGERWDIEPRLGRVVDGFPRWLDEPVDVPRLAVGVADRVGRLKALGNAVVPQQAYPIFRAIAEVMEHESIQKPACGKV